MNNLYQKSTLINQKDIQEYITHLQDNKTIIINNGHHFVFTTQLFNIQEMYSILALKNEEDKDTLDDTPICLCKGFYDSSISLELTPKESSIYTMLIKKFWPGSLHICVRAKSFVDSIITNKEGFVIMNAPTDRYIQKLLEKTNMPLVSFLTRKKGSLPLLHESQVERNYSHATIPILNKRMPNKMLDGLDSTTIMIQDDTITLMKRGALSFDEIKEHLTSYSNEDIRFKINIYEQPVFTNIKPVYTLRLMDLDINTIKASIISELRQKTKLMIEKVVLVDFNQTHLQYKDNFYGYVDLSEKGDIQEYIQNVYSVLHTIMKCECTKIYMTDIHLIAKHEYQYIQDIIESITKKEQMIIPLQFLK
jgi:tRNA A37 threonylcarbamoyladenosine synthetase subunit TsaC/SUA5/YrdC